jgi:hypothetical protein
MNRSNSSGDHSLLGFILFFTRIYQPLGAVAHSYTFGLLANILLPVRWVLAVVAVPVFASGERYQDQ